MATGNRTQTPDAALLQAVKAGDHNALEILFYRYYKPLCHYIALYLTDPEAAEELVSDIFVWIWEKRQTLEILEFRTYVYAAAKHAALDHKKKKRLAVLLSGLPNGEYSTQAEDTDPQRLLEIKEQQAHVMSLIGSLPERQQQIVRLSRFSSHTPAQIADMLGISVSTVEIHFTGH